MGRKRQSRFDLPPRLYEHHGSYWYRPRYGKPINVGKDLSIAKLKWAELENPASEKGSLESLLDWYLYEYLAIGLYKSRFFEDRKTLRFNKLYTEDNKKPAETGSKNDRFLLKHITDANDKIIGIYI